MTNIILNSVTDVIIENGNTISFTINDISIEKANKLRQFLLHDIPTLGFSLTLAIQPYYSFVKYFR